MKDKGRRTNLKEGLTTVVQPFLQLLAEASGARPATELRKMVESSF
jgi:hypothetical protein